MSRDTGDTVEAVLRASPPGFELWIPGLGRSLWPLLRSGDAVRVIRAGEGELMLGDLAYCVGGAARWVHPVVGLQPLRTVSLQGIPDPPGEVLGRVVSVRVRGRVIPVGPRLQRLIRATALGAERVRASPAALEVVRVARRVASSNATRVLRRRWMPRLTVRPLVPDDLAALLWFVGDHLPLDPRFLERQLRGAWQREGVAVGAVGPHGRLWGLVYLGSYRDEGVPVEGDFVRSLYVRPLARGFGLGRELLEVLLAEAARRGHERVFADVLQANSASRALFASLGFGPSPRAGELLPALEAKGLPGGSVLLERALHSA